MTYAVEQILSREEIRIRLSRWQQSAYSCTLIGKAFFEMFSYGS
jgi:hypothetical protein